MKLQDKLPDGVEVDGRFYRMDFDFRNVLKMLDILSDETLLPEVKAYNAVHCLCKRPRNVLNVMDAIDRLLFDRKRKKGQRLTDFVQDAGLIRAAFRQTYGIDLYKDKLHWIEFTELLRGIPEGTRYVEVVGIRAREIPAPTNWNQKEREWLMRAKADVALDTSEKEQEEQYQHDVDNIGAMLMKMAGGE